jgi:hypothetical protein
MADQKSSANLPDRYPYLVFGADSAAVCFPLSLPFPSFEFAEVSFGFRTNEELGSCVFDIFGMFEDVLGVEERR